MIWFETAWVIKIVIICHGKSHILCTCWSGIKFYKVYVLYTINVRQVNIYSKIKFM